MKKLVILALVLGLAGVASAALTTHLVAVDRDTTRPGLQLYPSDNAMLQIVASPDQLADICLLIAINGPATASMANVVNFYHPGSVFDYTGATADRYLYLADLFNYGTMGPLPPGVVVSGITFHCDGPGDVTITTFDMDNTIYDNVTVNQIPEPMTLGLLALGGMLLRRGRR